MQGFTSPPSFGKNPRWPTKMATNEHFQSGFGNGNNQNFFLDSFKIPNMYVKKIVLGGWWGDFSPLLLIKTEGPALVNSYCASLHTNQRGALDNKDQTWRE